MIRSYLALVLLALACPVVYGEQYWVQYDPTSGLYPEETGWERYTHAGGDQRYFEDGALVLDGLASRQIADYYEMYPADELDPGPGELFIARWSLRVDSVVGYGDPAVMVHTDDGADVVLEFYEGLVISLDEPGVSAAFTPGERHQFELRSSDMQTYELLIDAMPALAGSFHQQIPGATVAWGDGAIGSASLTYWHGFGFGVVPEPSSLAVLAGVVLGISTRRGARHYLTGASRGAVQEIL